MNAVDLLKRLHQHRAWVNSNLLTAATKLSEEQLRSPFQIGQGSIWNSLTHLYAAEYVWLEPLLGNVSPGASKPATYGRFKTSQSNECGFASVNYCILPVLGLQ